MLANILCQHTHLTPGCGQKIIFFFSEITHLVGATRYNRGTVINIYILQPPFWVSLIFYFFHWNAQVFISDHYLFQLKTDRYVYFSHLLSYFDISETEG